MMYDYRKYVLLIGSMVKRLPMMTSRLLTSVKFIMMTLLRECSKSLLQRFVNNNITTSIHSYKIT